MLTTHYMDEAQALADSVTVIAAGRVVASGSPDTLGGRDRGRDRPFASNCPRAWLLAELPLPDGVVPQLRGEFVEFHVAEPTALLHTLTGWAVGRGEVLSGLAVDRPSLEDVYLSLTGGGDRRPGRAAVNDLQVAKEQVRYEQKAYWRNPMAAVFTLMFPVIFLIIVGTSAGWLPCARHDAQVRPVHGRGDAHLRTHRGVLHEPRDDHLQPA